MYTVKSSSKKLSSQNLCGLIEWCAWLFFVWRKRHVNSTKLRIIFHVWAVTILFLVLALLQAFSSVFSGFSPLHKTITSKFAIWSGEGCRFVSVYTGTRLPFCKPLSCNIGFLVKKDWRVSQIGGVNATNQRGFWYLTNSCVNTVGAHFLRYILYKGHFMESVCAWYLRTSW